MEIWPQCFVLSAWDYIIIWVSYLGIQTKCLVSTLLCWMLEAVTGTWHGGASYLSLVIAPKCSLIHLRKRHHKVGGVLCMFFKSWQFQLSIGGSSLHSDFPHFFISYNSSQSKERVRGGIVWLGPLFLCGWLAVKNCFGLERKAKAGVKTYYFYWCTYIFPFFYQVGQKTWFDFIWLYENIGFDYLCICIYILLYFFLSCLHNK